MIWKVWSFPWSTLIPFSNFSLESFWMRTLWESSNCGLNCDKQGIRSNLSPCVLCPQPEPQGRRKSSTQYRISPRADLSIWGGHLRFLLQPTGRNLLEEDLLLPAVDACGSSDGPWSGIFFFPLAIKDLSGTSPAAGVQIPVWIVLWKDMVGKAITLAL